MNTALRSRDVDAINKYDAHARAVTSGLNQLRPYEGSVGRGIQINDPAELQAAVDRYRPGETVQERAFVSTDTRASFPGNVQFDIYSRTGRDISELSRYAGTEAEVLFPPGTKFQVLSRRFDLDTGAWHIELVDAS